MNIKRNIIFALESRKKAGVLCVTVPSVNSWHSSSDSHVGAFRQDLHQNNAYDTYRPKIKSTQKKIIFLTWEELNKLREFEIPAVKQALDRVCDVFLFQCFTGLRYSDVFNFRRSDIKGDHIEITTVKTSDSLIIE